MSETALKIRLSPDEVCSIVLGGWDEDRRGSRLSRRWRANWIRVT